MTSPFEVTLASGEVCEVTETDLTVVILRTSASSPPGSLLSFSLAGVASPYRVKVRGCRKTAEADQRPFRIEGRLYDVTREQRAALVAACR